MRIYRSGGCSWIEQRIKWKREIQRRKKTSNTAQLYWNICKRVFPFVLAIQAISVRLFREIEREKNYMCQRRTMQLWCLSGKTATTATRSYEKKMTHCSLHVHVSTRLHQRAIARYRENGKKNASAREREWGEWVWNWMGKSHVLSRLCVNGHSPILPQIECTYIVYMYIASLFTWSFCCRILLPFNAFPWIFYMMPNSTVDSRAFFFFSHSLLSLYSPLSRI